MTPPAIVFTDFDGTVTLQDSNDYLTENLGFGLPRRLEINDEILNETKCFRDGFLEMLESIPVPFQECVDVLLSNIKLDPGFKEFYEWCAARGIPVVVVSSGMKPYIVALLKQLVGDEAVKNIEVLSNELEVNPITGNWKILFRHPELGFGHDKSLSIRDYLKEHDYTAENMPPLFYCGDGVSDLSAAKETNLLFAKHGKDLITYCRRENIPYTEFNNFADIFGKIKSIIDGGKKFEDYIEN